MNPCENCKGNWFWWHGRNEADAIDEMFCAKCVPPPFGDEPTGELIRSKGRYIWKDQTRNWKGRLAPVIPLPGETWEDIQPIVDPYKTIKAAKAK